MRKQRADTSNAPYKSPKCLSKCLWLEPKQAVSKQKLTVQSLLPSGVIDRSQLRGGLTR